MTDPIKRIRFEYGKHMNYAVRHGWLGKGLTRMGPNGLFQAGAGAVVELGLGSSMVTSLRYWLEASGLAEPGPVGAAGQRSRAIATSALGRVLLERDVYLEYPASWWFVHLNLARRPGTVFSWFFNEFLERGFGREACVDSYLAYARAHATNEPSANAARRDVACLLLAYGSPAFGEAVDPEDAAICPLRDLQLVRRTSDKDRFERTKSSGVVPVPIEAFLAAAAALAAELGREDLTMGDLLGRRRAPGTVFGLAEFKVDEMAILGARQYAHVGVTLDLLGNERQLRVPDLGMDVWLDLHFRRIGAGGHGS